HRARRPQPAAEPDLLLGVEVLAPEEHDLVVEEGPADLRHLGVVEVGGQVGPVHDGTAGAGDLFDGDHGTSLRNRASTRRRRYLAPRSCSAPGMVTAPRSTTCGS